MSNDRDRKALSIRQPMAGKQLPTMGPTMSRRRFVSRSLLGLGCAAIANSPFGAVAQQLEPFTPPPNSLSQGQGLGLGLENNKPKVDFTEEMREYVIALSRWAKSYRSDFSIIAMNALELTEFLETTLFAARGTAEPARNYLRALDGLMIEAPFYGFENYGEPTNAEETKYILGYLERLKFEGLQYLIVDYTQTWADMQKARQQLSGMDALYYGAPPPGMQLSSLAKVPNSPIGSNPHVVDNLRQSKNYAMVLDSSPYGTKHAYIDALLATNYDTLIIDPFHRGTIPLTYDDMNRLRYKKTGTPRTLMAYLNIATAETYRYYWQSNWRTGNPSFLSEGNLLARWGQEHHVHYWSREWQSIIYGSENSYLGNIMKLGFDGVVLAGLDEYAWWLDY
jgi:cysteinyl-tRNA synthetase